MKRVTILLGHLKQTYPSYFAIGRVVQQGKFEKKELYKILRHVLNILLSRWPYLRIFTRLVPFIFKAIELLNKSEGRPTH
jgi:hypothetical protein